MTFGQRLAGLGLMLLLVGCHEAGLQAVRDYESAFACSPDDFVELEALIHKYFAGAATVEFANGSEAAYRAAETLNQLLANKCPRRVLRRCAEGHEEAQSVGESDELHSAATLEGPLQALGLSAQTDRVYENFSQVRASWGTYLPKAAKFHQGVKCFSKR